MSKDPDQRFSSVLDLARALLPFAGERVRVLYAKQVEGTGGVVPPSTTQREQDAPSLSGAARTTGATLAKENGSGAGKLLLYGTVSFVAVTTVFIGWAAYALVTGVRPTPSPDTTTAAPATSASAEKPHAPPSGSAEASDTRGPIVHPCSKATCDNGSAWCDERETKVACCAPGLVARSLDGVCACPPGGTTHEELVRQGCKAPDANRDAVTRIRGVIEAARPDLRRCYQAGLADASFEGKVLMKIELTPDGDVFDARVESSSIVEAEVQRCALKRMRSLRFPPPVNGAATFRYPLHLNLKPEP